MHTLLKKIITQTVLQKKRSLLAKHLPFSPFALAKGFRELKLIVFGQLKDIALITLGIFSAAFGFKGFLLTNHFIDGGATGISLLINALTDIRIDVLILVINLPFIILGYRIIGKWFAIKTALSIAGLALCLAFVEFPDITKDNLLVAIFGGFFLGAGIGLSVRGGAVIDGTEVLAIFLSRKLGTTIGDIIILINVLIFGAAAYFLTFEIAMYSMITYLSASKTLDFIIEGIDEYTGVTIISVHDEDIRDMIVNQMGRGVTIYAGKRGTIKEGEKTDINIIYSVITRLELNRLNAEIAKIDPNAFVVMSTVNDTKGGMIKKRSLQH